MSSISCFGLPHLVLLTETATGPSALILPAPLTTASPSAGVNLSAFASRLVRHLIYLGPLPADTVPSSMMMTRLIRGTTRNVTSAETPGFSVSSISAVSKWCWDGSP